MLIFFPIPANDLIKMGVLLFFFHEDIPWPRKLIEERVFGGLEVWEGKSMTHMMGDTQEWLQSSSWENLCWNTNYIAETKQTGWCGFLELESPLPVTHILQQDQFEQLLTNLQTNELCGSFSLKSQKMEK